MRPSKKRSSGWAVGSIAVAILLFVLGEVGVPRLVLILLSLLVVSLLIYAAWPWIPDVAAAVRLVTATIRRLRLRFPLYLNSPTDAARTLSVSQPPSSKLHASFESQGEREWLEKARYRKYDGVLWEDKGGTYVGTGGAIAVGPLCPNDKTTLGYISKTATRGISRDVRDSDWVGERAGKLWCPACDDYYALGDRTRDKQVETSKREVERIFEGLRRQRPSIG